MDGVIGVVTCFAANYAPKNWATCDGQLLAINTNQALFSILGTTYGGDGRTNFALPDMRGRSAISAGPSSTGVNYPLGLKTGQEGVTLTAANLPPHNHDGNIQLSVFADSNDASVQRATNTFPGRAASSFSSTPNVSMLQPAYQATVNNGGGGQPWVVRNPYQVVNYIICLFGIFPSRS